VPGLYAAPVDVSREAPVFAESEIEVAADPDVVWDVVSEFRNWPRWNPDVKTMSVEGDLAPGSRFTWKSGPATIKSTIQEVEPPRLITWTGRTLGTSAKHVYRLEPSDGRTVVQTLESFEGWLPRLLRGRMTSTLKKGLDDGLRHLKAEAERRAGR
jgi:hypothetical protein